MSILSKVNLENSDNILNYIGYMKIAHYRDIKNKRFLETKVIYNKTRGTISKIEYNKDWHLNQAYIYNTCKIDELNRQAIENDLVPVFVTFTLSSEYHKSIKIVTNKKTKAYYLKDNPNYNPFISVKDGYEELLSVFRSLYNDFKIDRKRVKGMKFIRVIEPHKDFTPHLHAILYVPSEHLKAFENHYKNTIKKIGRCDYKELDKADYAVTYLLKYVQKTLEGDDSIRGWSIHHSMKRTFTMSNLDVGINRQIFSKITRYVKFDKENKLNYFQQILEKVSIKKILKDVTGKILKLLEFGALDSSISVNTETIRTLSYGVVGDDFDCIVSEFNEDCEDEPIYSGLYFKDEYDVEFDVDIEKEPYKYRLDEFIIFVDSFKKYDKKDVYMYNKGDYYEN